MEEHKDSKNTKIKSKRKTIYGIIKLLIFLMILLICYNLVNNITKRKNQIGRKIDFFNQEENFDVLFFGSSKTVYGIFPQDLWKKYGMISYNCGSHSERMATTYYNMKLATEIHKPKLIVVDAFYVFSDEKVAWDVMGNVHTSLDIYKPSYTKYLAINDLFEGEDLLKYQVEFLWPFSMFHSRWNQLTQSDFKNYTSKYEKGADTIINVATPQKTSDFKDVNTYNQEETKGMKYLRKIIEYCRENDMEILVVYLPYPATDNQIATSKYTKQICDEYNVNYLNFLGMDVVDFDIDCYDEDSHLNPSGARKVTDYIGKYIQQHYDIPDQRNNEAYSFWNEDYEKYIDLKISNLKANEQELNNYLMLLYDEKDICYEIKISSRMKIEEDNVLQALLQNLNNNYTIDDEVFKNSEKNKDKTVKITTWDNRNGGIIKQVWF